MNLADSPDTPHDYDDAMIAVLQLLWGDGFLSPGGPDAVEALVADIDLVGANVLDVGCGAGGLDMVLVSLGATKVTGVDVVPELIDMASANAAGSPYAANLDFRVVEPETPLPFADGSFDVVFTKDAWLHVVDKPALLADVHRVLRPGGQLAAGDWMKGPQPYSADMLYFVELEGIPYRQVTLGQYAAMLAAAGFVDVRTHDATAWYASLAAEEYARLQGELFEILTRRLGDGVRDHFIENWRMLAKVTAAGELRPGRFWATKPQ